MVTVVDSILDAKDLSRRRFSFSFVLVPPSRSERFSKRRRAECRHSLRLRNEVSTGLGLASRDSGLGQVTDAQVLSDGGSYPFPLEGAPVLDTA